MPEAAVLEPPVETTEPKKAKTPQEMNAEFNETKKEREQRQRIMRHHAESATIYRVSYVGEKITIKYSMIENNKNNDLVLTSDDTPCEAFTNALHSLAPYVARLLNRHETEQKYQAMQLAIKGVIFSYKENGNIHVQISVTRQLDSGHCLTFCTPAIPMEGDDHAIFYLKGIDEKVPEILRTIIDEAKAYIGGRRSQGTLPFPEGEDDEGGDTEDTSEGEGGE